MDVDSFGSENLVSATMRCVKLGGYACLTSTDALALCGKSPGALSRQTTAERWAPNTQGVNELGLRVFVGDAVRIGAAMGLKVTPVFSLFHPHGPVFRAMLRVEALAGEWERGASGTSVDVASAANAGSHSTRASSGRVLSPVRRHSRIRKGR